MNSTAALSTENTTLCANVYEISPPKTGYLVTTFFLGFVTILGNGVLLASYLTSKSNSDLRKTPQNIYLLNLAWSDFCVGAIIMLPYSIYLMVGDTNLWINTESIWLLSLWNGFLQLVIYQRLYLTVLLSYDRYMMVSDPVRYRNVENAKRAWLRCALLWTAGFCGSVFVQAWFAGTTKWNLCADDVHYTWSYSQLLGLGIELAYLTIVLVDFVIPFLLLLLFNSLVFFKLRQMVCRKIKSDKMKASTPSSAFVGEDNRGVSLEDVGTTSVMMMENREETCCVLFTDTDTCEPLETTQSPRIIASDSDEQRARDTLESSDSIGGGASSVSKESGASEAVPSQDKGTLSVFGKESTTIFNGSSSSELKKYADGMHITESHYAQMSDETNLPQDKPCRISCDDTQVSIISDRKLKSDYGEDYYRSGISEDGNSDNADCDGDVVHRMSKEESVRKSAVSVFSVTLDDDILFEELGTEDHLDFSSINVICLNDLGTPVRDSGSENTEGDFRLIVSTEDDTTHDEIAIDHTSSRDTVVEGTNSPTESDNAPALPHVSVKRQPTLEMLSQDHIASVEVNPDRRAEVIVRKRIKEDYRRLRRAACKMLLFVTILAICWIPCCIVGIVSAFQNFPSHLQELSHILLLVNWSNSAIDPFLYFSINRHFKYEIRRMFLDCKYFANR